MLSCRRLGRYLAQLPHAPLGFGRPACLAARFRWYLWTRFLISFWYSYRPYSNASAPTTARTAGCKEAVWPFELDRLLPGNPGVLGVVIPSTVPMPLPDVLVPPPIAPEPSITLAAFGVGLVVQYHLPSANAHAWPSSASP